MNDPHTRDTPFSLSESGVERRDRMLEDLIGEMRRVHRSRRFRRRTAIVAVPVILVAAIMSSRWFPSHISPPDGNRVAQDSSERPGSRSDPAMAAHDSHITLVRTNANVLDRYRASPALRTRTLTDDELLETLAAIDRPAGIVRAGERVWLTHSVTDDPRGL